MRHRIRHRKLSRTSAHRKALFRNQLTALFTHERIITTLAKAKELRPLAERMVTLAGTGTLAARRRVLNMVPDKDVARRLFDDIAPRFTDRPGGYTRIMRLGRRHGDGAELAIIEFVDYELADHDEDATPSKKGKPSLMDRAKGVFGGGAATAETGADKHEGPAETGTAEAEPEESDERATEAEAVSDAAEPSPAEEDGAVEMSADDAADSAETDGDLDEEKK
jgi:large subunit ribosomal protein L17